MTNLFSLEAEQAVLGSILSFDGAYDAVSDKLRPTHFGNEQNAAIYAACQAIAATGSRVDLVLVAERLSATGELEGIGLGYLGTLAANAPGMSNIGHYADVIVERHSRRKLVQAVAECQGIIADPDASVTEMAERASSVILSAAEGDESDAELFTLRDGVSDLYRWLEEVNSRGGKLSGISTGFPDIDKRCNGLHGGELWIVAARPGMGKTNFALNVAGHAARHGSKVMFFSLEMSKRELSGRMAACMANMSYSAMQAQDWEGFSGPLGNFIKESASLAMRIDDRAGQTIPRIRTATKRAKRQLGGLDLVVVDYLQLIKGEGGSRYEQVTDISRELKVLAKDFDVPVLCLAQISRAAVEGTDKRPQLHHLKDSGAIEQDADVVMMLHREDDPSGEHGEFAEAIFRKIRHGQPGTDPLIVDFNHCRFNSADRESWQAHIAKKPVKQAHGGYQ